MSRHTTQRRAFAASLLISTLALHGDVRRTIWAAEPPKLSEGKAPGNDSALPSESPAQRDARMMWWREAKFGLFIHWGVYAVPAGKWGEQTSHGEWIMNTAKIPVKEYRALAKRFNPVKYDPAAWVEAARDAGMRYIVITSKHHDGFALYPSEVTDWDVADATPYGRDLLAPLVEEAHRAGLKIGFYYSQCQDWVHPGGAKSGFDEGGGWDDAHKGNLDDYLHAIAEPQVREILTRYPIDVLWWDTPMHMSAERAAPLAALTSLRPGIITNNRLGGDHGDTATPEQFIPVTGMSGDWETCMTLNGHWGYNAYDDAWKSSTDLIRKLAEIASKGGNFLLNVGPTAEGEFPTPCVERLREVGAWLEKYGESIYGTSAGPFPYLSWGTATRKGDRLYLHVFDWQKSGSLRIPLKSRVKSAWLLCDDSQRLEISNEGERVVVAVPHTPPDAADSVVVLDLAEPAVVSPPLTASATAIADAAASHAPAAHALDGTTDKCWRAPADVRSATLEIDLGESAEIAAFGIDEPDVWPRLSQQFKLESWNDGQWRLIAQGKTNGHGVRAATKPTTAQRVRLTLEYAQGAPGVAELQLYSQE